MIRSHDYCGHGDSVPEKQKESDADSGDMRSGSKYPLNEEPAVCGVENDGVRSTTKLDLLSEVPAAEWLEMESNDSSNVAGG